MESHLAIKSSYSETEERKKIKNNKQTPRKEQRNTEALTRKHSFPFSTVLYWIDKHKLNHLFNSSIHHPSRHKLFLCKTIFIIMNPKHANPSFSGSSITDSSDSTSPARQCCSLKGTDNSNMLAIFWSWTCVENPELYGREERTKQNVHTSKSSNILADYFGFCDFQSIFMLRSSEHL